MYYDFFGFREPPFSIAPDPRYLYLSDRHKEALAHLMYGVQGQGGFIVITGEVGTGKTTVSRCFIENVPDNVDIALILNPRLSARELLSSICDELEIPHEISATIKELVDLINQDLLKAHAAGRHKVLMIDEAQNLSAEVLEQLRLLTNLETAEKKLLQIVLLGQPELQEMLALPELRQLNQRVTARYHLDAIGREELPAYLRYRLSVAGMRGDIFSQRAVNRLYRESQGIPRLINLISDRALLGAYAEGEHEITVDHIRHAAKEVRGHSIGPAPSRSGRSPDRSQYLVVAASILVAIIGTAWLFERWSPDSSASTGHSSAEPLEGAVERLEEQEREQERVVEGSGNLPEEPSGPGELAVPDQLLDSVSAFQVLFGIWGRSYQPAEAPVACDWARENGLGCLNRQGSRRSLEFLDRPAMLQLQDEAGNTGFVVLRHLNGDTAEVAMPSGNQTVSFASIERYWFGEYRVLWRLPEYLTGDGFYSNGGGEQLWIGARMMDLADRHSKSRAESDRVKRMNAEEQVRWYQALRGLTVDGIAGAMTIIQINNDLEASIPRLKPLKPEGRE
ncbi:peptidoglycan-binding protein [Marinobacter sp. EhC06]|jgi:general secretion pathway protein A|uniref:AAA family ATPase n=1 Tax=Marinobacter TaxID=2742 RepID=UPI0007DA2F71|nr:MULTISPECIES: AAA family ATPase [unclassified Marinobacter]OAN95375.1 peptidoglycan-binding protein [Marinobacter sp. EhN04]OAN95462.1 peptidoglycan-binding protein [Marinobacter sp. EhC06]